LTDAQSEQWYVKTKTGENIGPLTKQELTEMKTQGRIDPGCQILKEGWANWDWAANVFPDLRPQSPAISGPAINQGTANPYASPQQTGFGISNDDEQLNFTPRMLQLLSETKPWLLFMGVLGYIAAGIMVLGCIGMFASALIGGRRGFPPVAFSMGMLLVFGAITVIYFVTAHSLWTYGSKLGQVVHTRSKSEMEKALTAQKTFWRIVGIGALVMLIIYAILLFGAITTRM